MSPERRATACLLLLVATLPLVIELLPNDVDTATLPLMVVLAAGMVTLLPSVRILQALGLLAGTSVVIAATFWLEVADSLALVILSPLALVILTQWVWVGLAGLAGTMVAVAIAIGTEELFARPALGGDMPADRIGQLVLATWVLLHMWWTARALVARWDAHRQLETARALDGGIRRDMRWLESVAKVVAEPGLAGPVRGHGLAEGHLALAARVDSRTLLLGWLEGRPLGTLTVGWALCAAARAGSRNPRALLRLARSHFDEIVPPSGIRWLAFWDRRTGEVRAAPISGQTHLKRCVLTPRGPVFEANVEPVDADATLRGLIDDPMVDESSAFDDDPSLGLLSVAVAWVFAAAPLLLPMSAWSIIVGTSVILIAQAQIARVRRSAERMRSDAQALVIDRSEIHDDLRNQIARLHGTLLPYRIEVGETQATAHRLRGEVLDGSFADMMVDSDSQGLIFAGEVSGRGIAARFLGLAAQTMARVSLSHRRVDLLELRIDLIRRLRTMAAPLRFNVRLRLGMVTMTGAGTCRGHGMLERLVMLTDATQSTLDSMAPSQRVKILSKARLDGDTNLYLTPATALPGPEDDTPELAVAEGTARIARVLRTGDWHPATGSIASLFSLVYDGVSAPSHGTLIELSVIRSAPKQDDEEEDSEDATGEGDARPTLSAVEL